MCKVFSKLSKSSPFHSQPSSSWKSWKITSLDSSTQFFRLFLFWFWTSSNLFLFFFFFFKFEQKHSNYKSNVRLAFPLTSPPCHWDPSRRAHPPATKYVVSVHDGAGIYIVCHPCLKYPAHKRRINLRQRCSILIFCLQLAKGSLERFAILIQYG